MKKDSSDITNNLVLVGHPFAPIGMGEHVRCTARALSAVGYEYYIRDIYGIEKVNDPSFKKDFASKLVYKLSNNMNLYHINGDEVEQALAHMRSQIQPNAYDIIYPVWELSNYPSVWAKYLDRFAEIWAPSKFVFDAINKAIPKSLFHMPLPVEAKIQFYLPRKYFSLPESSYLFLFYFDFRSYISRKNPFAVIEAFEKLLKIKPGADICLVIKLNTPADLGNHKKDFDKFMEQVNMIGRDGKIIIINKLLTDNETKNLVRNCDCFVSLHHSEGFGRGISEAMYLGKPVIATGYSGNMDFMNKDNSLIVDYTLVDVKEGEYPFAAGQVWADPDIEQAVKYMLRLVEDQEYGRALGEIASRHIRTYFSFRAAGIRYANRLDQINDRKTGLTGKNS